jgi:hypothetical protein
MQIGRLRPPESREAQSLRVGRPARARRVQSHDPPSTRGAVWSPESGASCCDLRVHEHRRECGSTHDEGLPDVSRHRHWHRRRRLDTRSPCRSAFASCPHRPAAHGATSTRSFSAHSRGSSPRSNDGDESDRSFIGCVRTITISVEQPAVSERARSSFIGCVRTIAICFPGCIPWSLEPEPGASWSR